MFNIEVAGPHNYFVRGDESGGPGVLVHNKPGHYVIEFSDGCVYIGKGDMKRMRRSLREKERKYGSIAINAHWRPSASNVDAFRDEAYWMDLYGWDPVDKRHQICFYNRINSPGHGRYNIWK